MSKKQISKKFSHIAELGERDDHGAIKHPSKLPPQSIAQGYTKYTAARNENDAGCLTYQQVATMIRNFWTVFSRHHKASQETVNVEADPMDQGKMKVRFKGTLYDVKWLSNPSPVATKLLLKNVEEKAGGQVLLSNDSQFKNPVWPIKDEARIEEVVVAIRRQFYALKSEMLEHPGAGTFQVDFDSISSSPSAVLSQMQHPGESRQQPLPPLVNIGKKSVGAGSRWGDDNTTTADRTSQR
jgi:hypothetical protein